MMSEKELRELVAYLRAEDWLDPNVFLACDAIEQLLTERATVEVAL